MTGYRHESRRIVTGEIPDGDHLIGSTATPDRAEPTSPNDMAEWFKASGSADI
ncbi:MAG TPA: hypothetical protein VIT21_11160 [Chthoniobacterales bacterium]